MLSIQGSRYIKSRQTKKLKGSSGVWLVRNVHRDDHRSLGQPELQIVRGLKDLGGKDNDAAFTNHKEMLAMQKSDQNLPTPIESSISRWNFERFDIPLAEAVNAATDSKNMLVIEHQTHNRVYI